MAETLLFARHDAGDEVGVVGQLGVGGAHLGHGGLHQDRRHQSVDTEGEGMADGPADDAAQHVAPVLVGREHPIADQEAHRPTVVGEDAQRGVDGGIVAVGPTRGLGRRPHERS